MAIEIRICRNLDEIPEGYYYEIRFGLFTGRIDDEQFMEVFWYQARMYNRKYSLGEEVSPRGICINLVKHVAAKSATLTIGHYGVNLELTTFCSLSVEVSKARQYAEVFFKNEPTDVYEINCELYLKDESWL